MLVNVGECWVNAFLFLRRKKRVKLNVSVMCELNTQCNWCIIYYYSYKYIMCCWTNIIQTFVNSLRTKKRNICIGCRYYKNKYDLKWPFIGIMKYIVVLILEKFCHIEFYFYWLRYLTYFYDYYLYHV